MRIIHTGGFSLDERKEARQVIFSNLVVAFKIIMEEMTDLGVEFEKEESEVCMVTHDRIDLLPLIFYRALKRSSLVLPTLAWTKPSQKNASQL